jgi:hypothetical protein
MTIRAFALGSGNLYALDSGALWLAPSTSLATFASAVVPGGAFLGISGNWVYWSDTGTNTIAGAPNPPDVTAPPQTLYTAPAGHTVGMVAANADGVAWLENPNVVHYGNIINWGVLKFTALPVPRYSLTSTAIANVAPTAIALAPNGATIFAAGGAGMVQAVQPDGTSTALAFNQGSPPQMSTDGTNLYWATGNDIRWCPVAACAVKVMVTAGQLGHFADGGAVIYYIDTATQKLMKVAK